MLDNRVRDMEDDLLRRPRLQPQEVYHTPRELEHPLHPIRETKSRVFVWVQPRLLSAAYELWSRELVIATLRFRSFAHRRAIAAAADGYWTIEDLQRGDGTVHVSSHKRVLGRLTRRNDLIDSFTLDSGEVFLWTRESIWKNEYTFRDESGRMMLLFSPEKSMTARARVEPAPLIENHPFASLLTLLGFYLILHGAPQYDSYKPIKA